MHLQSLRIFIISLNANYRIAHLMPSRANDSFLPARGVLNLIHRFVVKCQCPLGLMTHFYDYEVRYKEGREVCQCPLGLMTHFYWGT